MMFQESGRNDATKCPPHSLLLTADWCSASFSFAPTSAHLTPPPPSPPLFSLSAPFSNQRNPSFSQPQTTASATRAA
eukprot:scaffold1791_cov179-Alexandrium_tamarense.AAC.6